MAPSSSVLIEEVKSSGKGRKVLLVGPSLPFQGATWGGRQALVTTWYPGNGTEATQHVMGPQLIPSAWEGIFRRTLMGKTPAVYTDENGAETKVNAPTFLRDVLEDIFTTGARLRVTWSQTRASDNRRFDLVREGRASDWDFPHDRVEDIAWKITFAWVSKGIEQQKAVALRDSDIAANFFELDSFQNELVASVETARIKNTKKGILNSASKLTLGQLEALAKAPSDLLKSVTRTLQRNINQIRRAVDVADKFRNAPYQTVNDFLNFCKNNVAVANQYYDQWSRAPAEQQTTKQSIADVTRAMVYFGQSSDDMRKVARSSQTSANNLDSQLSVAGPRGDAKSTQSTQANRPGSILAVHIVKQGDSPLSISMRYYNNPDNALDILAANRLPINTIALKSGKILIIPVLGTNSQKSQLV